MDNQAEPEQRSSTSECKTTGKPAVSCMELPEEEKEIAYVFVCLFLKEKKVGQEY